MPITGTKLFVAGDVLTAAQMNQYAMRGVKVYADAATRDAAYGGAGEPTLEEGETCYLLDSNVLQIFTGTVWTNVIGPGSVTSATIPSNPVDGQIWYHQPTGTNAIWTMRYNASATSAYKWEFAGGQPIVKESHGTATTGSVATATWVDTTANSLNFSTPFAGAWICEYSMTMAVTANCTAYTGIAIGATNPTATTNSTVNNMVGNAYTTIALTDYIADQAASTTLTLKYQHAAGTNQTISRYGACLKIWPWRLG